MLNSETQTPTKRLKELRILLPKKPPSPIGAFCNVKLHGDLAYVSGQGPVTEDGNVLQGKLGQEINAEIGRKHARLAAINMLAALKEEFGTLDVVSGVVKMLGLVNSTPNFDRHPYVIDGASTLLAEVFGLNSLHARSAFGVASLPNQISVELEGIFSIEIDDV